ncbi:MAG TPA: hypothetical protein VIM85_05335 [Pseudomonadales bacterium]
MYNGHLALTVAFYFRHTFLKHMTAVEYEAQEAQEAQYAGK